jgi:Nuclease-related domain
VVCGCDLAVGDEAMWDRASRTLTCVGCDLAEAPVVEGEAGASALREYDRLHLAREQHAREKLGGLGVLLAKVIDEPQRTKAWQQGGRGEVRTGERLSKHLDGHGVRLLHDRRVPGHGSANIDHLAVGPGGVTVIDSKTYHGAVRVDRIGGLFSPRRSVLLIGGRDRTGLIVGVERQIGYVRSTLGRLEMDGIDVRGALCFPNVDGLPLFSELRVREIVIDGPKRVAKLARRPGLLDAAAIERVWVHLGRSFPPA